MIPKSFLSSCKKICLLKLSKKSISSYVTYNWRSLDLIKYIFQVKIIHRFTVYMN